MSALSENTVLLSLSDTDSLRELAREGLSEEVLPTVELRPVLRWALDYYRASDTAPTVAVLVQRFSDVAERHSLDFGADIEESIEWAVADLKSDYAANQSQMFSRDLATAVYKASPEERVGVLATYAAQLSALTMSLQPRYSQVDLRSAGADILREYTAAAEGRGQVRGLAFGMPEIDTHTGGIWEGELAVVAGYAGLGKSWLADLVAYREWQRGRVVTLFTLENSISMTQMRIACMALHLPVTALQGGLLAEPEVSRLTEWCNDVLVSSGTPLHIVCPDITARTPQAIVETARAYGTDSLIVDQLTFLNPLAPKAHQSRTYEVRSILHDLHEMIATGRHQMPCLLMHQVSREGQSQADKSGRLNLMAMADSAEVERTGDWVFGLYASRDLAALGQMQIQGLKARRQTNRTWDLSWAPQVGLVSVTRVVP